MHNNMRDNMTCLECGISSGCGCYPPPKVKYKPRDHKQELKLWLEDMAQEVTNNY